MGFLVNISAAVKGALSKGLDLAIAASSRVRSGVESISSAISHRLPGIPVAELASMEDLIRQEMLAGKTFTEEKPTAAPPVETIPLNPYAKPLFEPGDRLRYVVEVPVYNPDTKVTSYIKLSVSGPFSMSWEETQAMAMQEAKRRLTDSPTEFGFPETGGKPLIFAPEVAAIMRWF